MRYRIYMRDQQPVEVDCVTFKIEHQSVFKATLHLAQTTVDVYLPAPIERINDDHGRLVWEKDPS